MSWTFRVELDGLCMFVRDRQKEGDDIRVLLPDASCETSIEQPYPTVEDRAAERHIAYLKFPLANLVSIPLEPKFVEQKDEDEDENENENENENEASDDGVIRLSEYEVTLALEPDSVWIDQPESYEQALSEVKLAQFSEIVEEEIEPLALQDNPNTALEKKILSARVVLPLGKCEMSDKLGEAPSGPWVIESRKPNRGPYFEEKLAEVTIWSGEIENGEEVTVKLNSLGPNRDSKSERVLKLRRIGEQRQVTIRIGNRSSDNPLGFRELQKAATNQADVDFGYYYQLLRSARPTPPNKVAATKPKPFPVPIRVKTGYAGGGAACVQAEGDGGI